MKSILVIDTPSSCSECKLCELPILNVENGECLLKCSYVDTIFNAKDYIGKRHPNCPLISIDIDELEDNLENLALINDWNNEPIMHRDSFKSIKSTIAKLKGGNK